MTLLRVASAVLVAYAAVGVLGIAGHAATAAAFDATTLSAPPAQYLLINVLIGMAAAGVGGYLGARLAPAGRVTITVGLLLVVFLVIGVLSGRAEASPAQPLWYQAVVTLLGACGLMSGAVVQRAQEAERARRRRV
jgi:hypothetical protein